MSELLKTATEYYNTNLYKRMALRLDYFSIFHINNPIKDKNWKEKSNNKAKIWNAVEDYIERRI